jgi:hypothetical protein
VVGELGGSADLAFEPDGFHGRFAIPLEPQPDGAYVLERAAAGRAG